MHWDEQRREFKAMVSELEDLLFRKGKEYAGDHDALGNFKRAGKINITPLQKLGVYLEKHLASIDYYIGHSHEKGFNEYEPINGRLDDAINYLFLMRCLIKDIEKEKKCDVEIGTL